MANYTKTTARSGNNIEQWPMKVPQRIQLSYQHFRMYEHSEEIISLLLFLLIYHARYQSDPLLVSFLLAFYSAWHIVYDKALFCFWTKIDGSALCVAYDWGEFCVSKTCWHFARRFVFAFLWSSGCNLRLCWLPLIAAMFLMTFDWFWGLLSLLNWIFEQKIFLKRECVQKF